MTRYLTGLFAAYVVVGIVAALGVVPLMLLNGQPSRAFDFVPLWIGFGVPTVVILAVVVGPCVLGLNRVLSAQMSVVVAAILGPAVGPAVVLLAWFVFRENNEQIAGLIQFWRQVPGEFLVGAVPPAASGIFFCLWLTRNKAQPIRIKQLRPTSHEN